ncbi:acyl-CoA thioesterase [Pontibacillus yanchengensis]|uniref:Thioesterase n=1 Tax=Pontibacillus yanchengensis Y32 TaxID=1385514 RepID=A0A0A2TG59_9BACI|nr:thioesterase family protein [Pontibacillus yanchengensis]KGP73403.1 thioesterase [Pontibacillus yanchengensis Y32]
MHKHEVVVRFCETDMLGHVNNKNYFVYLEDARIQFFYDAAVIGEKWNYVLASTKCDFVSQAFFHQTLMIESMISRIGNSSFQLDQNILDKDTGNLIAKGESTIVCFNFDKQASEALSDEVRANLEHYLVNV